VPLDPRVLIGVPVPNAAAKRVDRLHLAEAKAVLAELRQAQQSLQACFGELENVLAKPVPDAGALTSVRLKLAGIRLTRGPLIARVSDLLSGRVTPAEQATLEQLRSSHHRLLQVATVHTSKWTLEAIGKNWAQYRRDTRELLRQWVAKAEREQRLIYPVVERFTQ
jgi:hypothetical protein